MKITRRGENCTAACFCGAVFCLTPDEVSLTVDIICGHVNCGAPDLMAFARCPRCLSTARLGWFYESGLPFKWLKDLIGKMDDEQKRRLAVWRSKDWKKCEQYPAMESSYFKAGHWAKNYGPLSRPFPPTTKGSMKTTQKRWIMKFVSGVIIGLILTLLLGADYVWVSVGLGLALTAYGIVLCHKATSCLLALSLVASPMLLADDYYGGYNGATCYCFVPAALPEPEQHACIVQFNLQADDLGHVQPHILGVRHPKTLVGFDEFNASLAVWGIDLNGGMQYSKNGLPVAADQMPCVFGGGDAIILFPDRQQYRVVVELTTDLGPSAFWQPVARFSVPAGETIEFEDSPEGPQTFYRVRMAEDFEPAAGPIVLGCGIGFLIGAGVVCVLAVRACAKNKKKFENMLPPKDTNTPPAELRLP